MLWGPPCHRNLADGWCSEATSTLRCEPRRRGRLVPHCVAGLVPRSQSMGRGDLVATNASAPSRFASHFCCCMLFQRESAPGGTASPQHGDQACIVRVSLSPRRRVLGGQMRPAFTTQKGDAGAIGVGASHPKPLLGQVQRSGGGGRVAQALDRPDAFRRGPSPSARQSPDLEVYALEARAPVKQGNATGGRIL